MPGFDILGLIPLAFQSQILGTIADLLSGLAAEALGDRLSQKLAGLKSDSTFRKEFRRGLQRAAERFVREYELEDEDLVAAIAADKGFLENKQVQAALLAIIRKPGIYLVDERATIVHSFETVLPERKNRQRVDRAVSAFLKCLAEEVWTLPELRGIYALQFQRMAAEAMRQQVEEQRATLEATAGLSADLRQAMLQLTDALARQRLVPPARPPELPPPLQVRHNLPQPDYGTFVGRVAEIETVERILRPYPHSQYPLVTIDGIGGIGKSALALEIAHRYARNDAQLPPEERFEAIIWTSAKASRLTEDGVLPRPQVTRTLEDIYTAIAVTLGREEIHRARPEEQNHLVVDALTAQRTLLIVDNLETVDDERVNAFLRELPAPTKAVVTTRHRLNIAYPVRLVGLAREDGLDVIAQEGDKRGIALAPAEAETLYRRTGGVPLAIVWSVAQMVYGYDVDTVLQHLESATGDIACFCFERAVNSIRGSAAYTLLLALSFFAFGASREALGYVARLDGDALTRDRGLEVLERLSLVNRSAGRFTMLPLTAEYTRSQRRGEPHQAGDLEARWVAYFVELTATCGNGYWRWHNYDVLAREGENVLHAVDWAYGAQRAQVALALMPAAYWYLDTVGRWNDVLQYGERTLELAGREGDRASAVGLASLLGWTRGQMGEYAQAKAHLERGLAICESLPEDEKYEAKSTLLIHLGQVTRKEGNLAEARVLYDRADEILRSHALPDEERASLDYELGKLARDRGAWEKALVFFERVQAWARDKRDQSQPHDLALALGAQGSHALTLYHLGEYERAKQLCVEAMAFFEDQGGKGYLAVLHYRYALIEEALGNRASALDSARAALHLGRRVGMKPEIDRMEALVRRLEAQQA